MKSIIRLLESWKNGKKINVGVRQ